MNKFIIIMMFILIFMSVISHHAIASELTIEGNGEDSVNDVAISTNQQTTVDQSNEATYTNDVSVQANTGENIVSDNTAENITMKTGDVSVSETIENSGNISLYETVCCDSPLLVDIASNGTDTINSVSYKEIFNTYFSSQNTLTVQNSIEGNAITGQNEVIGNRGNVHIQTGTITVYEKIINGPVNIISARGASRSDVNGSGSSNNVSVLFENTDSLLVTNEANISNNSSWNLITGDNLILRNVGNIDMKTGDIVFDSFIKNGLVNASGVTVDCCADVNGPQDPEVPGGGLSDPELPKGTIPPPTIIVSANTSSQDSGRAEEKNISTASGNVLPITGGWLLLAIICSILILLMGVFLRLRSGRSPNLKF